MRLNTIFRKLNSYSFLIGIGLLGLAGCRHKHPEATFDSNRQYRHALYRGGYETIKFKPDGSVFVKMLVNGVDVIANGEYERDKVITVKLPTGPKRSLVFIETPDRKLLSFDTNHRWGRF